MRYNFSDLRQRMVDSQIRTVDVADEKLLESFLKVPREKFVCDSYRGLSYSDQELPLDLEGSRGRYMLSPASLAKLLQLGHIQETDVCLIIGGGLGYSAAILSSLASSVLLLEEDSSMVEEATKILSENAYDNVAVVEGPLSLGYPSEAPYDVIFIEGRVEVVSDDLLQQLRDGGRLICIEGTEGLGYATLYKKEEGFVSQQQKMHLAAKFMPHFERKKTFSF